MPAGYVGEIIPYKPDFSGTYVTADRGSDTDGFTRNWQTFWGVLIASTLVSMVYCTIKAQETAVNDDKLMQAALVTLAQSVAAKALAIFGSAGTNAALASFYIMFETT